MPIKIRKAPLAPFDLSAAPASAAGKLPAAPSPNLPASVRKALGKHPEIGPDGDKPGRRSELARLAQPGPSVASERADAKRQAHIGPRSGHK